MASETTAFGHFTVTLSHTDACGSLSYLSVISVMNRIVSAIVRVCAYRFRMTFSNVFITYCSNVLLRIDFDFTYVPEFGIF